jgi:hypothetical protein
LPELYAAIDDTNDLEFLAFVVGDKESVSTNLKQLPLGFTHMAHMHSKHEKKLLLDRLSFDGNIRVCCVQFGLNEIKSLVKSALSSVNKLNMSSRIINNKIAYEIAYDVRRLYADFTITNGYKVEEIEFEVDNRNVLQYLKDSGLHHCQRSETHKIADCIVHANGHHFRLDNKIVEEGEAFKNAFHNRVAKSLTR